MGRGASDWIEEFWVPHRSELVRVAAADLERIDAERDYVRLHAGGSGRNYMMLHTIAGLEARLWLPDANDIHVLATAVQGNADGIITMNAKDFPRGILAEEGLSRNDPDAFLLGHFHASPDAVTAVAQAVVQEARRLSGEDWNMRSLMKKARLPRLGKALMASD